jgi:hypothetical protein
MPDMFIHGIVALHVVIGTLCKHHQNEFSGSSSWQDLTDKYRLSHQALPQQRKRLM